MSLPDEKRDQLAKVLCRGNGDSIGDRQCINYDRDVAGGCSWCTHDADALAPLVAGWLAEAEARGGRVVAVRHERDCDWVTNNSRCNCGLDDAYESGYERGRAEALRDVAREARERGDIGKEGGCEAWDWLAIRADQAASIARTPDESEAR